MESCDCDIANSQSGCQHERKASSLLSLCFSFYAAALVKHTAYCRTLAWKWGRILYFFLYTKIFMCLTLWRRDYFTDKKAENRGKQLSQSHLVNKCWSKNLSSINLAPQWRHFTPALQCIASQCWIYKSRTILLGDKVLILVCSGKSLLAILSWKSLKKS